MVFILQDFLFVWRLAPLMKGPLLPPPYSLLPFNPTIERERERERRDWLPPFISGILGEKQRSRESTTRSVREKKKRREYYANLQLPLIPWPEWEYTSAQWEVVWSEWSCEHCRLQEETHGRLFFLNFIQYYFSTLPFDFCHCIYAPTPLSLSTSLSVFDVCYRLHPCGWSSCPRFSDCVSGASGSRNGKVFPRVIWLCARPV